MEHTESGHKNGGWRDPKNKKSKWPDWMKTAQIMKAIEEAYKTAEKAGKQQVNYLGEIRQCFHGLWNGRTIEFFFNFTTKTIETAYPID